MNMSARSMKTNAIWNVAEVLASSTVLFVLYKLILSRLGISALGVWSLVLATTSLARIADLGAAGGLGRYIALSFATEGGPRRALSYLETAVLLNAIFYGVLSFAIYWPAWLALPLVTHGASVAEARALLPYAIGSFALLNVSNVVTAALIGLRRSYQKSVLVMLGLALQMALALILLDKLGLRAVALGQVAQYSTVTLLGWGLAVKNITGRQGIFLPRRFDSEAMRDLVGFGLRLQVLNIAAFPFEPITKFIFSAVGGLPALGLYELASRGFLQVRQVVIAPSQNLTPVFTSQLQDGRAALAASYTKATTLMQLAGAVAMLLLAVGSPLISLIWLGQIQPLFVGYSVLLALGWFCNITSTPGYYLGIASGRLRWNIVGALTMTTAAAGLGLLLGSLYGPLGIAGGAMAALIAGNLVTWLMNCRDLGLRVLPSAADWKSLIGTISRGRLLPLQTRTTKA